ncbi:MULTISPECIES: hypothetical protein [unclassified Streptomyces]|uniref:hypothetical protein n=1 Tax=unclassified Streptomyces TaxID=2593676 RepID=UPI00148786A2|nr:MULTISPECIES: hypothetical protein [unclassified Streptomyces]
MVFDARKVVPSREPFPFIGMDGQRYELPNINTLTGEQMNRLQGGDESVMEEIADEDALDAIEAMPLAARMQLAQAWAVHGGRPGKAASPSSRTPGRKRRSR